MRSTAHSIASLATVCVVFGLVCLMFPFDALRFTPSERTTRQAFAAAFVTLSPEEESQALQTARTSWQQDAVRAHNRVRASLDALPPDSFCAQIRVARMPRAARDVTVPYPVCPYSPSAAAPLPPMLPKDAAKPIEPAFPKKELLKLD